MKPFDLILEDGSYWVNCYAPEKPASWRNRSVKQALSLKALHRMPLIGSLFRNYWAKRNGALLHQVFQGSAAEES